MSDSNVNVNTLELKGKLAQAVSDLLNAIGTEVQRLNPVSVDMEHLCDLQHENEVLKRRNRGLLDETKRLSVENAKLKMRLDRVKQDRRDRWEGVVSNLSKRARHAERQVSELNAKLDIAKENSNGWEAASYKLGKRVQHAEEQIAQLNGQLERQAAIITQAQQHLKDALYTGPEEDDDPEEDYDLDEAPF